MVEWRGSPRVWSWTVFPAAITSISSGFELLPPLRLYPVSSLLRPTGCQHPPHPLGLQWLNVKIPDVPLLQEPSDVMNIYGHPRTVFPPSSSTFLFFCVFHFLMWLSVFFFYIVSCYCVFVSHAPVPYKEILWSSRGAYLYDSFVWMCSWLKPPRRPAVMRECKRRRESASLPFSLLPLSISWPWKFLRSVFQGNKRVFVLV